MFFTAAVKNFFKKFVKSLHEMKKFVAVFCEICYTSTRKTLIAEDTFTKRTRIEEIALLIEKNGKMSLEELAKQFPDVSDMTLRRDLLELEKENKVIRVRGGAMSVLEVQKRSGEAYAQKSTINTDAKKVIAKKAVALIDDGVSLFLDGGTTALALAKELPDKPCHIFTSGLVVAEELAHKKQPEVILVGGSLIKENLSTASPYTKVFLENSNFELAIISASAFSFEQGFSCISQVESELLKFILARAKMVYMMLDTSKISKIMPYTFASAEDIDVLITDDNFPPDVKEKFETNNIVVI